ncbi:MAG: hypothetical protein HXX18_10870 [Bacteroidetes bacterium]|nr:hypothetical protein [Bacteroidota bacterium]
MKQGVLIMAIILFGLQSCNVGTYDSVSNEKIDAQIKNEINDLDKIVVKSIFENNPKLIKGIMSDILVKQSGDKIDDIIHQTNSLVDNKEVRVLDQFYVKNTTKGLSNTVMSGLNGQNDYIIHYKAENKEIFISLIVLKNGLDELLSTNIYGKYKEGWKLNIIHIGEYTLNGMTATELYKKAKEQYENGFLVDAANNMFLSSQVLKPANGYWQYQIEQEMKKFYELMIGKTKDKYQFPITLMKIETKPQILNISPQGMNEGYFPLINYLTKIDLKDTLRTRIENDKIHNLIGTIFKGIDLDKKYIFYKAWNEIPDGKNSKPNYGFVKKLEIKNGV